MHMPKLHPVSAEMLRTFVDRDCYDAISIAHDYADRIQKGYVDDGAITLRDATDLLRASEAFAGLAMQMLYRLRTQEDRAELEKMLRAQINA